MNKSEIQVRDQLHSMLDQLDKNLLLRVFDYTNGLLAAKGSEETDWWDELPLDQQEIIHKGLSEIEQGEFISDDTMRSHVKQLFNQKIHK